jgi:benzil reductase ((S)-benzoin forming)
VPNDPRLAIITGTSSGVGAALAVLLLERGWTVLGMSRRPAAEQGDRYRHVAIDLADLPRLAEVARETLAPLLAAGRWSRIALVNNAGAIGAMCALEDADPQAVAGVYAVNAIAPIALMGCVVRAAPATPIRIVNVSTGAAVQPIPGIGDYGSSKAALRLASMTFAAELTSAERPGGALSDVQVLCYAPGIVDTPLQQAARAPRAWNRLFVGFHESGQLVPADAPAREIADFLDGDGGPAFVERRFGTP